MSSVFAADGQVVAQLSSDVHDFTNETIEDFSLHFTLINNGNEVFDPRLSESVLLIDGKPLPQSGQILGSGPRDGRGQALPPGDKLQFVYGLGYYFSAPGEHKVIWKGKGFESKPLTINVRMETAAWKVVAQSAWARVSTERAIYKSNRAAPNDHCLVHVKVENVSGKTIGFEHPKRASVFYPNQWAESEVARRRIISEMRSIQDEISAGEKAKLLTRWDSLTKIAPGKSFEYFITFNGGNHLRMEESRANYVIIVMDGHIAFSDGKEVQLVYRSMQDSLKGEVPLHTPVRARTLPEKANILFDD
ncbi:MAG: hypothetical protein JST01_05750 [Cyanobacteria bacterium SZAS TMP-1]|nr:hypothetical protein [Cyanobacteria bacterium SZAS TMP-1]